MLRPDSYGFNCFFSPDCRAAWRLAGIRRRVFFPEKEETYIPFFADDRKEPGNAVVCGCFWRSSENAFRAHRLRPGWNSGKVPEMRHSLEAELETPGIAFPWMEQDVRLCFHGEAGCRLFDPDSIRGKQRVLRQLRDTLEPPG